jgi:SAM-dependent methyltransferase
VTEPAQHWQAARYAADCRFVADLGEPVLRLLAPGPGLRVLDLGCGDGALTERIAASGATVVGVDAAPDMVAASLKRGLHAKLMDGAALAFAEPFDAVFSNAALHWMTEPDRVIAGVWRSLVPGGRFVAEFGGFGNVAAVRLALSVVLREWGLDAAALSPWYFPTDVEYRARLEQAGFVVDEIALVGRPTRIAVTMRAWLENFAQSFVAGLPPRDRGLVYDQVSALLAPVLRDEAGGWTVDYVRLRVAARRPA